MLNDRVRTGLVVLIAVAWGVSTAVTVINPNYEKDPSIDGAFGLVTGALIAAGKKDNGKDHDENDDAPRRGRRS